MSHHLPETDQTEVPGQIDIGIIRERQRGGDSMTMGTSIPLSHGFYCRPVQPEPNGARVRSLPTAASSSFCAPFSLLSAWNSASAAVRCRVSAALYSREAASTASVSSCIDLHF